MAFQVNFLNRSWPCLKIAFNDNKILSRLKEPILNYKAVVKFCFIRNVLFFSKLSLCTELQEHLQSCYICLFFTEMSVLNYKLTLTCSVYSKSMVKKLLKYFFAFFKKLSKPFVSRKCDHFNRKHEAWLIISHSDNSTVWSMPVPLH